MKKYYMKEIKYKIIDILEELKQSNDTIIGVIGFLQKEEDALEMLNWLNKNKNKKLTQHQIIDKLDLITM